MLSPNHQTIITPLVELISAVPQVKGIVLGGSQGLGFATEASDYDLVLFYEGDLSATKKLISDALKPACDKMRPTREGLSGRSKGLPFENRGPKNPRRDPRDSSRCSAG